MLPGQFPFNRRCLCQRFRLGNLYRNSGRRTIIIRQEKLTRKSMIKKIKSLWEKGYARIAALTLAVAGGALALGSNALAAVDPDVASTTETLVTTMKENITGVISTNIANIVIVGVIIFSISFVWRLARRFMK